MSTAASSSPAAARNAVPAIQVRNLHKSFGSNEVLKGIDFHVDQGEVVCVIGPSGSGKSTLLRCVNRLEEPTSGTIMVEGVDITDPETDLDKVRTRIGMVFQQFNLFPHLNVLQNLTLAQRRAKKRGKAEAEATAMKNLAKVGLADRAKAFPAQLSGGQQQRVSIARAMINHPALLLCDEPLLSLDLNHQQAISALIDRRCHEQGSAVVFVTHEINPVIDYVDRVLYLAGGTFRTGTPDEVLRSDVLSEMYGSRVEVLRSHGRIVVLGIPDATTHVHGESGDDHGLE